MNTRRKFIKNLTGAAAGIALLNHSEQAFAETGLIRLSILHTNDIHCHIDPFPRTDPTYPGQGGLARLSGWIQEYRKKSDHVLLLDAGDMFQGTPYFNYYKGELILKVMSDMGYHASTIGNHEFDNGLEGINQQIGFARFPVINSNYDFSETILHNRFPKYKIFRKGELKIGVYGLGVKLSGLVADKNYEKTVCLDPVKTALKMESFLKNEAACDLIICLSHLGICYKGNKVSDTVVASQTHYTDLIVGGHTHTFLDEPLQLKNADGRLIIVNQAGWAGLMLGHIDFLFDRTKRGATIAYPQKAHLII